MGELILRRRAPGITPVHLAGLTGLYLLLQHFERTPRSAPALISGTYADDEIRLRWTGPDGPAFRQLVEQAYVHTSEGLFRVPAIKNFAREDLIQFYQILTRAFVQHPRARTPDRDLGKQLLAMDSGDDTALPFPYTALKNFAHRQAFDVGRAFIDSSDRLRPVVRVVGWLFPGGGVRHQVFKETALSEPVDRALPLIFAPIGALMYQLASSHRDKRAQVALIFPLQAPLSALARIRRIAADDLKVGRLAFYAAGLADALMQYELSVRIAEETSSGGGAEAIVLGSVDWNQQKSRTAVLRVTKMPAAIDLYDQARQELPVRVIVTKDGNRFASVAALRELVAYNVVAHKQWYEGFAAFAAMLRTGPKSIYNHGFPREERRALSSMTRSTIWNSDDELALVATVHQAWRQSLAKMGERAKASGADARRAFEVEATRLRVTFAKAKTESNFVHAFADFVSRAGQNPELKTGLRNVLRMLRSDTWERARDLTLLALVSYTSTEHRDDPEESYEESA